MQKTLKDMYSKFNLNDILEDSTTTEDGNLSNSKYPNYFYILIPLIHMIISYTKRLSVKTTLYKADYEAFTI